MHQGNHLSPARHSSRFLKAGGVRLHCLDYGTAGRPPLLCLHGGGAHAHWFDFIAAGFTADYHVFALDLRGHGDSGWANPPDYTYERFASDIAEVAETLDLRDFILIGHSMGGMVSLLYTASFPGRVGRLVVVDTALRMSEERLAVLRAVGSRKGRSYATREAFIENYRLYPESTLRPELLAYLAEHSASQSADGRWRQKADRNVHARRQSIDGLPCWDRIDIPSLLVKGKSSPRLSPEIAEEVKARCRYAEIVEVPGSGHHVVLDNPVGFVSAVRTFLHRRA